MLAKKGGSFVPGSTPSVKRFWEGPRKKGSGNINWVEKFPQEQPDVLSLEENLRHAITLQYRKTDRFNTQDLHAIIVRNKFLHTIIAEAIPTASTLYDDRENGYNFAAPFKDLFYYYDALSEATMREKRGSENHQMGTLLCSTIKTEMNDIFGKYEELVRNEEITFKMLWSLFKPDTDIVRILDGHTVGAKVVGTTYSTDKCGVEHLLVNHKYLEWNGELFGWRSQTCDIVEFAGRRAISTLDPCPLRFAVDEQKLVQDLSRRGREWAQLNNKGISTMSYDGVAIPFRKAESWWDRGSKSTRIKQRVVLDTAACFHYEEKSRFDVVSALTNQAMAKALEHANQTEENKRIFFYCSPHLRGYGLKAKSWYTLSITNTSDIIWDQSAYPSLLLPKGHKELIFSFADAQLAGSDDTFDDVISGKGKGLIMLLSGAPGTGKTLTAEAMAEHMHRPLYQVSLGQLGADADALDTALNVPFDLATRWNAVLLLDEADIFLEKRSDSDLQRNKVVGVMLSRIEYYQGILFLTTNRKHAFDPAFRSRIHVAIRYPDLDAETRAGVWRRFLDVVTDRGKHGVDVSDTDLAALARYPVNGREIRNLVKSAMLLASSEGVKLTRAHLDLVWGIEHDERDSADLWGE